MTTRHLDLDGLPLSFDDEGRGPPLVFLHGSMGSTVYWDTLVPMLLGDYRCVRLDFPGHGRSGRSPTSAYGIADQVEVTIRFLDAVVGPCVVVGASAGAGAGFGVAARRPDLVRGLYSDDAHPGIYTAAWLQKSPTVAFFRLVGRVLRAMPPGFSVAEYAAALGSCRLGLGTLFEVRGPAFVAFFARLTAQTDPAFFDVVTDPSRFWTEEELGAVVGGVRCPVHVAYGDAVQGSLVSEADIDTLATAGVPVTRRHFPGAGHMISPLFPAQSHADLRAFLGRIGG